MASFSQLTPDEALTTLHSSLHGLDHNEARTRLAEFGPNTLKKTNAKPLWLRLVNQFVDPMIVLMLGASMLAFYLGSTRDMIILITIVILNAIIGFFQEYKAENIIASLQSFLSPKAKVLRAGKLIELDACELVPGDIVSLVEGDSVPADIRLLSLNNLATNDFSLTGESNPKPKFLHALPTLQMLQYRDNQIYLGTTVARGNCTGVVYATGMKTEIGKIAQITAEVGNESSPLQKEIGHIAVRITYVALLLAVIIFVINYFQGNAIQASLLAGLGIAAAMVPQGLPAQLSVTFSLGAGRLAQKKAIIKQLYAIETLGATTIICSDKTGTITTNEMTVQTIWHNNQVFPVSGSGYEPKGAITNEATLSQDLLLAGVLAATGDIAAPDEGHRTWYAIGDPTEAALVTLAQKGHIEAKEARIDWQEIKQYPFDSVRKMMSSIRIVPIGHPQAGKHKLFLKGSLISVLERSTLSSSERQKVLEISKQYTAQSLRLLGMATRMVDESELESMSMEKAERDLTFLGFVAMQDPPRVGVAEAISIARQAHIRTFIVTGDQAETAKAVAEKIGLGKGEEITIIQGDELSELNDFELHQRLTAPAVIFARTSPEDKLRIVKLLQEQGNVVAVTGDGVNDAPALKQADIGVAMGKIGTDVAKEAAEIVLTDDSYVTLVEAVKEGRTIFTNLKKTFYSTLSSNFGELTAVLASAALLLWGFPPAIYAIHILLVDLVGEMLPLMALTFDPAPTDLLKQKPRSLKDHFLSIRALLDVSYAGVVMGGVAVFNFIWFLERHNDANPTGWTLENPLYLRALTLTYVTLMFGQFANILSRRSEHETLFRRYFWSNPRLLVAIAASVGLMCIVIYTPWLQPYLKTANLQLADWLFSCLGFVVMVLAHELRKAWRRKVLRLL